FMNPAAGDFRLHLASPCINRGNISHYNNGLGFDLLGAARVQGAGLDLGAYEGGLGGARIAASVEGGGTLEPLGVTLYPDLPAQAVFTATPWPGRTLTHFSTNGVALPVGGNTLLLDLTTDQALNLTAHFAGTLYADAARPDDSGDGLSWATAKRTLQGAVAAAVDNDTVLVAPGLYQEGAAVTPNEKTAGYLMNRVVITNQITLRSRDGNAATVIQGAFDSGSGDLYGRGPNAVRCVFMSKGVLQGFTLTGGATDRVNLENENNRGGGVYAPEYFYEPQILDCVITNCASVRGGGTHAGTLRRCVLRDNYAANNSSAVRGSVAYDCLIAKNRTGGSTTLSAVAYAWCYTCTVTENTGRSGENTSFYNCILTDPSISGRHFDCCLAGGTVSPVTNDACFADAPLFVNAAAGDFRLAAGSPCIDRANRAYVPEPFGTDVTGDLRMQNAAVDLGAIEHDWRPALAAALDADGVTVSDLTPFVTHDAQAAHAGGSAVYLDGAAARADSQSAITMSAPWYVPYGRSVTLRGEVTGSGTLTLYEGETPITALTSGDGAVTLKHLTAAQKPFPLRVVYTVGEGDTGGALLDAFEGSTGMLFMLK
ncbi:MAG TPA: choice-of-anchor Q domain-containing protein, partial [Kiritimatiellia bacterium]|nr:choice-of-anchor Q domain-containing protein [Kiritimatiellia bacterium]